MKYEIRQIIEEKDTIYIFSIYLIKYKYMKKMTITVRICVKFAIGIIIFEIKLGVSSMNLDSLNLWSAIKVVFWAAGKCILVLVLKKDDLIKFVSMN